MRIFLLCPLREAEWVLSSLAPTLQRKEQVFEEAQDPAQTQGSLGTGAHCPPGL